MLLIKIGASNRVCAEFQDCTPDALDDSTEQIQLCLPVSLSACGFDDVSPLME